MSRLDLVPICFPGRADLLDELSGELERYLALEVRRRQAWFDPEQSFDASRGQYSSTNLLRMLLEDPSGSSDPSGVSDMVLGVAGVDLFAPVLTYVFGEAQLDGRAAVVSSYRLRSEAYGLPADDGLLFQRLFKESVHELGHVLGLVHCADPECVMHASTYVEDIDSKSAAYCTPCMKRVRASAGRARGVRANSY